MLGPLDFIPLFLKTRRRVWVQGGIAGGLTRYSTPGGLAAAADHPFSVMSGESIPAPWQCLQLGGGPRTPEGANPVRAQRWGYPNQEWMQGVTIQGSAALLIPL